MGLFSFSRTREAKTIALFDIDSASVGGALVRLHRRGAPEILFLSRVPIRFHPQFEFELFFKGMITALMTAGERLVAFHAKEGGAEKFGRIERACAVFAAPWYLAQTRKISWTRKSDFVVTRAGVQKLLTEEERSFASSALSREAPQIMGGAVLLERAVLSSELNGYPLSSPVGKNGKKLTLSFFSSLLSQKVKDGVDAALSRIFTGRPRTYHTYPYALGNSLLNIFPAEKDFLLVNIAGELSEIYLFRCGSFSEVAFFPSGTNTLLRLLSKKGKADPSGARALLLLAGAPHAEVSGRQAERLSFAGAEWTEEFNASLQKLTGGEGLPHTIFILGEDDTAHFVMKLLAEDSYLTALGADLSALVPLTALTIQERLRIPRGAFDPYMALMSGFFDYLFDHDEDFDALSTNL